MDCNLPGSSVHGISQARILDWSGLSFPSPGHLPDPGIEPAPPAWQANSSPLNHQGSPKHVQKDGYNIYNYSSLGAATSVGKQAAAPGIKSPPLLLLSRFSHVQRYATLRAVARQVPLSVWFSRQEYWSGLPCPSSRGSSQARDWTQVSCIAGRFFTIEPPGKPHLPTLVLSKKD